MDRLVSCSNKAGLEEDTGKQQLNFNRSFQIMKLYIFTLLILPICRSDVVDISFSQCSSFFYKNTPPRGFSGYKYGGLSSICQQYFSSYHFATLYSTTYRIPMYSAYRLDTFTCPVSQPSRRSKWFIEPQVNMLIINFYLIDKKKK